MTKQQIARQEVEAAFENFVKWETYGTAFDHMDARHIRLTDIIEIAGRVAGITGSVIQMRRRDWNGWPESFRVSSRPSRALRLLGRSRI